MRVGVWVTGNCRERENRGKMRKEVIGQGGYDEGEGHRCMRFGDR